MAWIGKVLSNISRQRKVIEPEVKTEIYKNDINYSPRFGPPGDDSKPLPGDSDLLVSLENRGGKAAVGYVDPKNASSVDDGERQIYSRDADGNIKAFIRWLKTGILRLNGTGDFAVRYNELETAFNQLKGDHDSLVSIVGTMTVAFNTGWTVVPNDGGGALKAILGSISDPSSSTADITPAKIEEIEVPS